MDIIDDYDDTYLEREFIEIDNIVHCLYEIGLFTDIECRKIVFTGYAPEAREAIFEIIQTKDMEDVKKIIEIFKSRSSLTWNPKILKRIFSFLNCADIKNCRLICKDWNVVVDCLYDDKYNDGKINNTSCDVNYPFNYNDSDDESQDESQDESEEDWSNHWKTVLKNPRDPGIQDTGKGRKSVLHQRCKEIKKKEKMHFYYNLTENEKKALFFLVLLSREPDEVENTMLVLRKKQKRVFDYRLGLDFAYFGVKPKAAAIQPGPSSSCGSEEKRDDLIAKVLKNHTVLTHAFKFLSAKEVRKCRVVCRDWNYVAEPFIRENSIVRFGSFHSSFSPSNFLRVSKYSSFPDLHFKNFHFQKYYAHDELTTFFSKFGGNIRRLKFDEDLLYCIPLCLSFTSNLTQLVIDGDMSDGGKMPAHKSISLDKLHSIKYLVLKYCSICAANTLEIRRITPLMINLHKIHFYLDGNKTLILNDFVDFTQAKGVKITGINDGSQIFDWTRDIFSVDRMEFSNVRFLNADKSNSTVNYLKLNYDGRFSGKLSINIKHLIFKDVRNYMDLSNLPLTIEKIAFHNCDNIIVETNQSIHLPFLTYLSALSCRNYEFLLHFKDCNNLTHLEVSGTKNFNIRWLPQSVHTLKVDCNATSMTFIGYNPEDFIELDFLIVGFITYHDLNNFPSVHIRPKKLVLQLCGDYQEIANVFISFLRRNKHIAKIYVQIDCYNQPSFESSDLSYLVDKESKFYEFSNGRGKTISKNEFFVIKRIADWQTAMNEYPAGRIQRTDDHCHEVDDDNCYNDITSADGELD